MCLFRSAATLLNRIVDRATYGSDFAHYCLSGFVGRVWFAFLHIGFVELSPAAEEFIDMARFGTGLNQSTSITKSTGRGRRIGLRHRTLVKG